MTGYLKLYRQFLSWEWYSDLPVRVLFLHCLLKANYNTVKWKGKTIKTGQFVTSLAHLAQETGLSLQETRTALTKLKSTCELTQQATSQYSIITVNNWGKWQGEQHAEQQASNKQATTIKERKKNKNSNTSYINSSSSSSIEEKISKLTEEEEEILKNISKRNGVKYFRRWLKKVIENNDHISLIAEERRKQAKKEEQEKEKKKEQRLGQGVKPDEVDSEIVKQWREKARKRL